jgi:ceramide glucosyltransferase
VNRGGLPTLIESLFINTDFAALVMLARKVERPTYAFGATIAIRRDMLERIGGFLPIADHLADDYQIGNQVAALGCEPVLCNEVVDTVISLGGWRRLFDHQLRWARTYRISRPGGYFGSFLTHGTFWAVANLLYHGFSPPSLLASGLALGVRILSAALFSWRFLATGMPARHLLWLLPKDLFVSLAWFLAFLNNTVVWSGRRFRVLRSGKMIDLSPGAPVPVVAEPEPSPVNDARRTGTNGR